MGRVTRSNAVTSVQWPSSSRLLLKSNVGVVVEESELESGSVEEDASSVEVEEPPEVEESPEVELASVEADSAVEESELPESVVPQPPSSGSESAPAISSATSLAWVRESEVRWVERTVAVSLAVGFETAQYTPAT